MEDRFVATMLGLALGDALGRRKEGLLGGETVLRAPLLYTDDGEQALALAESLVACRGLDAEHYAQYASSHFEPTRGYGPSSRSLLERIARGIAWRTALRSVYPEGNAGNGAATRIAPLALLFHRDLSALDRAVCLASSVTHGHAAATAGASLIARALAWLLTHDFDGAALLTELQARAESEALRTKCGTARKWLTTNPDPRSVVRMLGVEESAERSTVTAVFAFCRHANAFGEMHRYVNSLGGDVCAIGSIAGALFGAARGVAGLPEAMRSRLEDRERFTRAATALFAIGAEATIVGE